MTKQEPTLTDFPPRLPMETEKDYWKRVVDCIVNGADVRSKVDMREWTGSPQFHLNREEP